MNMLRLFSLTRIRVNQYTGVCIVEFPVGCGNYLSGIKHVVFWTNYSLLLREQKKEKIMMVIGRLFQFNSQISFYLH